MHILIFVLLLWIPVVIGQTSSITGNSARSPDIIINSQNISINPEKIKVTTEYANQSDNDVTETFVFTTPLNISVDTQTVQTQLIQHALNAEGRDVSLHITALGLPFDPIAAMHTIDASSNRDSIISKLLALRLIDPKENIPNWTIKTYYYWQYTFHANSNVIIEHSYKPNITIRNVKINTIASMLNAPVNVMKKALNMAIHWNLDNNDDNIAMSNVQAQMHKYISNIDAYCLNNNDYQAIAVAHQTSKNKKSQLETRSLTFKYNSDDLWARPLDRFTLTINSTDDLYPVLCWHDKMQREPRDSLRFSSENYVPMQDINVLYIEK